MRFETCRKIKIENFSLKAARDIDTAWLGKLISNLDILPAVPYAKNRHRGVVALPPDSRFPTAFVKTYSHTDDQHRSFRRRHPLRRLLPRYAVKEGRAYLNFEKSGLTVPKLLAFGEEWKWGVRNRGIIVIQAIQAPSVQTIIHKTHETVWIDRIFDTIAQIHNAGVTHGDAHLVNFLGRGEKIYSIDIENSKPLSQKGRRTDLINILVSLFLEIEDQGPVRSALARYERQTGHRLDHKNQWIETAVNKARSARTDKARRQKFSATSSKMLSLK